MKEIENILSNYKNRATLFQLNFFMLGKEPTIQAKLKRCADELKTRKRSMDNANLEIADLADQIELLKLDINDLWTSGKDKKRNEIKRRQMERRIQHLQKQISDIKETLTNLTEESQFFIAAHQELSKLEAPKDWDSEEVQLEFWNAKYSKEIKERLLLRMPIDLEIIRSVLAMPNETSVKQHIMKLLKEEEKLLLSVQEEGK